MKRSIYTKLLVGYVAYALAIFIVIITFSQALVVQHMEKEQAKTLYQEATFIASDYANDYYKATISMNDFQKHMEIVSNYLSADVWILDSYGNLLISSADSSIGDNAINQHFHKIVDFDIADFGNKYYSIGNFYENYEHDVLTVFSPINVNYENRGYVLIHKPVSDITSGSDGYLNITFYTILIAFIVALILLLAFLHFIYRPLSKITRAAESYAKGDFSTNIDVHTNDEIGQLASALNYMAQELGTMEEDQRKFVSNVSHDFRSPLTSIKGYVEAMQDGTIPYEMQDKYLNIILFETERLNKLTKSLIDLNQFGRHGIRLDKADFDINNMIRQTILTFEGTCSQKGITFDLVLTGKELFVTADMVKIQQVLYNLIDNATKFSNKDSSIKIETHIKNEKLLVSVKDSGIGIPKESLSKIWERFYKSDSSRGKDKKGTGLGLAIVKEIIQAHGENINVVSTEGVGTEFSFTLPLSQREDEE